MSSNLIDTEAGGETSQYESIQTVTKPQSKHDGQLGAEETQTDAAHSQERQENTERGEKAAANLRYGQAISEQGIGGKTTEANGAANQGSQYHEGEAMADMLFWLLTTLVPDGFGGTDAQPEDNQATETRQEQGYGSGSGVGA